MSVTITVTPASPVAKVDACKVLVEGLTLNDATTYDAGHSPSMDEVRYYLTFELGGAVKGKSHVFACNYGEDYDGFFNYIFPEAGSWTVRVSKVVGDTSVQTQAVTVS